MTSRCRSIVTFIALPALATLLLSASAHAHTGHEHNSFLTGFEHPIYGLDHLLAMVTVGLLSARMAVRHMWTLPLAFVAMMAAGGLLGLVFASEGLTAFEWGISISVLVFGLVAAAAPSVPVLTGNLIVAAFAICHGHAHVAEMGDASAWGYFPGMLLATGCLHVAGLLAGVLLKRGVGEWSLRAAGALIAAAFAVNIVVGMLS